MTDVDTAAVAVTIDDAIIIVIVIAVDVVSNQAYISNKNNIFLEKLLNGAFFDLHVSTLLPSVISTFSMSLFIIVQFGSRALPLTDFLICGLASFTLSTYMLFE